MSILGWLNRRKSGVGEGLNPRLADKEQIFLAPPLTPELMAAIRLISPQLRASLPDEGFRELWQKEQNGECWGEYEALEPALAGAKLDRVLEVGPGMGRSAVFFTKRLGLLGSEIHLYDGDGSSTSYTKRGRRTDASLCGNLDALRTVLDHNGCGNCRLFNARETKVAELPGPYDLIYSFYSVGFHWSLQDFMEDLVPLMHGKTLAVFTVHADFKGFPRLRSFRCRLLDYESVRIRSNRQGHKLLLMSFGELPQIGRDLWG